MDVKMTLDTIYIILETSWDIVVHQEGYHFS